MDDSRYRLEEMPLSPIGEMNEAMLFTFIEYIAVCKYALNAELDLCV